MKKLTGAFVFMSFGLGFTNPAFAVQVNDVAKSVAASGADLPGLLSAVAYLMALVLGVTGILKLKDHVENPSQTPLRASLIRFAVAGGLIMLPIVYEAMLTTINGGTATQFDPKNGISGTFLTLLAGLANLPGLNMITMDFNSVLSQILSSISEVPGFIAALAYILGLVIGVAGLLKIKEHVESPDQNPLREGVIRLLVGGALFGIPTIYQAMAESMPGTGVMGAISSIFGVISFTVSGYESGFGNCNPVSGVGTGTSIGDSLCSVILHTGAFPAFLTAIAYLIGLVFGFWGIFKIKAHVINPSQTGLSEGVTRLLAGGAFFSLPVIIEVARNTMAPVALSAVSLMPVTRYREGTGGCATEKVHGGLDCAMMTMMNDLLGPMHVVLNFFAFCAGMVFIMIGISRLIKSAQEGARGPGGLGTIGTFLAGGALISYNELIRATTQTLSMGQYGLLPRTRTYVNMDYLGDAAELTQFYGVISAILKFMILVGLISFVRGIFIIRGVAEGNSQSSLMAGATHVVGGALAVNLGPLIMAVQNTLGITSGITFT